MYITMLELEQPECVQSPFVIAAPVGPFSPFSSLDLGRDFGASSPSPLSP